MLCLLPDVLNTAWGTSRQEVSRRISQWLSGARDRRSGSEPARRKRTAPAAAAPDDAAETVAPAAAPEPAATPTEGRIDAGDELPFDLF